MNYSTRLTFLTRHDSNVLKGVLILLIVFGHNHILCPNVGDGVMMDYLYLFHVPCFFILPVFYDRHAGLTASAVRNIVVRCWWPYVWVCVMCYVAYSGANGGFRFGWEHVWAFVQGTQTPLKTCFGFVFPWFLPAFCSYSILLSLVKQSRMAAACLLAVSLALWAMPYNVLYMLRNSLPFALTWGVYYIAAGVVTFYLNKWWRGSKYIGAMSFVILSVQWATGTLPYSFRHIMPVAFFMLLLCLLPLLRCKWLEELGRCSLGIYLFNMFFVNLAMVFLPHNVYGGIISLAISLFAPWGLTLLIERHDWTRLLFFPRSVDDLLLIKNRIKTVML